MRRKNNKGNKIKKENRLTTHLKNYSISKTLYFICNIKGFKYFQKRSEKIIRGQVYLKKCQSD